MIYGVGIDVTEISRFNDWHTKSKTELKRIFSDEEIDYCLQTSKKSAERFAARYAAREAFFKAYQSAYFMITNTSPTISFLNTCKHIKITKTCNGLPLCTISWAELQKSLELSLPSDQLKIHISLSHTQSSAHALIIIASVT